MERDKNIEKAFLKYDIKEANGIDTSKELEEMLETATSNVDNSDGHIDKFINEYHALAESLVGERLSDIPMGRVVQLLPVMEREYDKLKNVYNDFKHKKCSGSSVSKQYDNHYAVTETLATAFIELGNNETTYIPELDELDVAKRNAPNIARQKDLNIFLEAMEYWFEIFDPLITLAKKAYETNDKSLYNAIGQNISIKNLYAGIIADFFETC